MPSADEAWFDSTGDQGGVAELSPFDIKALDEDMKKLYQKQLYYQQSCQLREVERVLRRVLRIWSPDVTGGVLYTAASAAEAFAIKTIAAAAAAKKNAGTVVGVNGGANGGDGEGQGLELTRLTRRLPTANAADDAEEIERDDRDLAAIVAAPSPELQSILLDAPATLAVASSSSGNSPTIFS